MTRYGKRNLKYSLNENFNLLPYVEWDRFVTQALEFQTPPFSSFGPSRDYGMDLCLEVYL